jgi:hypothetical protein
MSIERVYLQGNAKSTTPLISGLSSLSYNLSLKHHARKISLTSLTFYLFFSK